MAYTARLMPIEARPAESRAPWYALLVLLISVWSNSFVAIEAALRWLTPTELLAARFLPVGAFCTAYVFWRWRETLALMRDAGWKIALMGLVSGVGYNYFLNVGQTHVPAGTASILIATNPLQTYILAAVFLGEAVSWKRTAGLLTAFAGLYVVVVHGSHVEVGAPYIKHALLTLLAPLSWAIYTLAGKTLLNRHSPLLVTYASLALGSIPTYAFVNGTFFEKVAAMPWRGWFSVLYLAVACTILGFFMWALALKRLPASVTASFVYLNPPLSILSAALLLGHPVRQPLLAGLALVFAGIFLATRRTAPAVQGRGALDEVGAASGSGGVSPRPKEETL